MYIKVNKRVGTIGDRRYEEICIMVNKIVSFDNLHIDTVKETFIVKETLNEIIELIKGANK